jgi:hypothetical protein
VRERRRLPEEHIGERPVQPGLATRIVAPSIDRFGQNVRILAAKTFDFLFEARSRLGHQLREATVPQLIAVRERPQDASAGRLHYAFAQKAALGGRSRCQYTTGAISRFGATLFSCRSAIAHSRYQQRSSHLLALEVIVVESARRPPRGSSLRVR